MADWFQKPAHAHVERRKPSGRKHPEQSLQTHVAQLLTWLIPDNAQVFWSAIGHGGGGKTRGMILKGMGVKAGVPDIHLTYRGCSLWIELKAGTGLSPTQRAVHQQITLAGGVVAVCRNIDDVRAILDIWQIPTREAKPSRQAFIDAARRLADRPA
jgi:hypothetical protein